MNRITTYRSLSLVVLLESQPFWNKNLVQKCLSLKFTGER